MLSLYHDRFVVVNDCRLLQAYRHELDDYTELVENAMNDKTHTDAVLWKFCDLDKDPEDRSVKFISQRWTVIL